MRPLSDLDADELSRELQVLRSAPPGKDAFSALLLSELKRVEAEGFDSSLVELADAPPDRDAFSERLLTRLESSTSTGLGRVIRMPRRAKVAVLSLAALVICGTGFAMVGAWLTPTSPPEPKPSVQPKPAALPRTAAPSPRAAPPIPVQEEPLPVVRPQEPAQKRPPPPAPLAPIPVEPEKNGQRDDELPTFEPLKPLRPSESVGSSSAGSDDSVSLKKLDLTSTTGQSVDSPSLQDNTTRRPETTVRDSTTTSSERVPPPHRPPRPPPVPRNAPSPVVR